MTLFDGRYAPTYGVMTTRPANCAVAAGAVNNRASPARRMKREYIMGISALKWSIATAILTV
jgi:hypothetical protein